MAFKTYREVIPRTLPAASPSVEVYLQLCLQASVKLYDGLPVDRRLRKARQGPGKVR